MCNKHVHSTVTHSSRFQCPIGVINKPTTVELCMPLYHLHTDDLLWRNYLSPHLACIGVGLRLCRRSVQPFLQSTR